MKRLEVERRKVLVAAGDPSDQEEVEKVKKSALEMAEWAASTVKKKDRQITELMEVIHRNSEGSKIPRLCEYIRKLTIGTEQRDQAWNIMEHGVLKALHDERSHFRTDPWGLVTMDRSRPAPNRTRREEEINPPEI